MVRMEGTLTTWKDDRGFGFITPAHGGQEVFVHAKAFQRPNGRPQVGQRVTFEVELSPEGKKRACRVQLAQTAFAPRSAPFPRHSPAARPFTKFKTPLLGMVLLVAALYAGYDRTQGLDGLGGRSASEVATAVPVPADAADALIRAAFAERRSDVQVAGQGMVSKVLADDNDGSRHQRFILALPSGHKVLVAHNIDLAPRIQGLQAGDTVAFNGEYEWTEKGGVIHWTHHDPAGRHENGWLKHGGQTYQ